MQYINTKALLITLCLVFSHTTSNTVPPYGYPLCIKDYVPAAVGALLIGFSAPVAATTEDDLIEEYANELRHSVERRRASVYANLEKLQSRLNALQAQSQAQGAAPSEEEKKVTLKLNQAREEYRTIDLDYQADYLRIRPRARLAKKASLAGIASGSLLLLYNVATYIALQKNITFFSEKPLVV